MIGNAQKLVICAACGCHLQVEEAQAVVICASCEGREFRLVNAKERGPRCLYCNSFQPGKGCGDGR